MQGGYTEACGTAPRPVGWKGPCFAVVPSDLASHMSEAMDFMGAVVDLEEPEKDGKVRLWSEGYYTHIGS